MHACKGHAGKLCNSIFKKKRKKKKEALLTTFSWIWQLDTDMLMDSSSGREKHMMFPHSPTVNATLPMHKAVNESLSNRKQRDIVHILVFFHNLQAYHSCLQ